MAKIITFNLITTSDVSTKKEAEILADKIVNCKLPQEVECKIKEFTYADEFGKSMITDLEE